MEFIQCCGRGYPFSWYHFITSKPLTSQIRVKAMNLPNNKKYVSFHRAIDGIIFDVILHHGNNVEKKKKKNLYCILVIQYNTSCIFDAF
jgi:hypothetical protein